jgi:hypothetical protein
VRTGGHPTPETRPKGRVSGGCENWGQNKAKAQKSGLICTKQVRKASHPPTFDVR